MNEIFNNLQIINNSPITNPIEIVREIKDEVLNGKTEIPLSTGFESIDEIYKGFKKNQIIVLAGRSSMGKTTVALNFVYKLLERGKKVLYIDLEEQSRENIIRLMTIIRQYPFKDYIESQYLTNNQKIELENKISDCEKYLSDKHFYYINKPNLSLKDIKDITVSYQDLDLVIIDHLTKIKSKVSGSRYEKVTDVANNLRWLSSELGGVPLLLPAQINRGAVLGSNKEKTPTIADIKGSGEIEENADVVILLNRKSYFKQENQNYNQPDTEAIEIIIGKNRHGATGKVHLKWNAGLSTISEINEY